MARFGGLVTIDVGTGDGRLPYALARKEPDRLFIGIDANAAALRERSGRAARIGLGNVLYVRAAVEDLPPELHAAADRVTVVLPWGSLLAAVAEPRVPVLRAIRALCQPGARLSVILAADPSRDRAELLRLRLPALDAAHLQGAFMTAYGAAGFDRLAVRRITFEELGRWRTTWAGRLAHGRERLVFEIEARANAGHRDLVAGT